jgi:hypothetical protein
MLVNGVFAVAVILFFFVVKKTDCQETTIDLPSVSDKLCHARI